MPPVPRPGSKKGERRVDRTLVVVIAVAVAVVVALVVGSLALRGGDDEAAGPVTGDTALVDGIAQNGTVLGNPAASVTLIQYEDLQCPACKSYTDGAFPSIVEGYVRPGTVKVDFRGLAFLGSDSEQALRAVLAAAKQDKAWQMIELLYDNQGEENSGWVTDVLIEDLAASIDGLDVEKLLADAESDEISQEMEAVGAEAAERNVGGTPTFFVQIGNEEPYPVQAPSFEPGAFDQILDDALEG
jgi:protein-disulfide isomerase